jgi:carbon monoxide dehydrogenase subunit G
MTKVESRIGKIKSSEMRVYFYLSDFDNFEKFLPADKIKNWKSKGENCRFTIEGIGDVGLKIIEKEPNKLIKITGDNLAKVDFNFWIQIKQVQENDTRIKLTIKADLNPMMKMVAIKPLQEFVNILVDRLEQFQF